MTAPQGYQPQQNMPAPRPTVMPVLHLVSAGLMSLGILFILLWLNALSNALNNLISSNEGAGGALIVFAMLFFIAGIIVSGYARFLESRATSFVVNRVPGP